LNKKGGSAEVPLMFSANMEATLTSFSRFVVIYK